MTNQSTHNIYLNEELLPYTERLDDLENYGINIYPYNFPLTHSPSEIRQCFEELISVGIEISTASRVLGLRKAGKKLIFIDLAATSAQLQNNLHIQVMARRNDLDELSWEVLDSVHLGDWLGVVGPCFKTKSGEPSVLASKIIILSKITRPIPFPKVYKTSNDETKIAYSIQDKEILWKYPELDMLIHRKAETLIARSKIINETRNVLINQYDCIEIETPYLNQFFGGAEATPFVTYLNALKQDMFLAISPEIELKRALVGGLGSGGELGRGVFTFARNFRNEGIDKTHNPEFSSMEVYIPFVDYAYMIEVMENIYRRACISVHGKAQCLYGDVFLDFKDSWPRYRLTKLVSEKSGILVENWSVEQIRREVRRRKLNKEISIEGTTTRAALVKKIEESQIHHFYENIRDLSLEELVKIVNRHKLHQAVHLDQEWDFLVMDLFEIYCEPYLIEPCHVILHPEKTTVLCKESREGLLPNGHKLIERFESYAMGMELSNAYSELNNPIIQRKLVEKQANQRDEGDDTAMPHNELFLRSVEMGLPPTGGLGVGIDRLVMLLTNSGSIRDVIAFPMIGS